MSDINLFMIASREAFRYPSVRGELTVEQLWQLPLLAKDSFDLNTVAKDINTLVKASADESFVQQRPNPAAEKFKTMLELVKEIISIRIEERDSAERAAAKATQRRKLLAILERRQETELESLSVEQINERLAALED